MTLPPTLIRDDVYYVAVRDNQTIIDGEGKPYHYIGHVDLSTHTLTKAAPGCSAIPGSTSKRGVIGFGFYKENVRNCAVMSGPMDVKPVGDMYVGIRDRQSPCAFTAAGDVDPIENKYYGPFLEAYQTIRPLTNE